MTVNEFIALLSGLRGVVSVGLEVAKYALIVFTIEGGNLNEISDAICCNRAIGVVVVVKHTSSDGVRQERIF